MRETVELHNAISAVCPIVGVSIGRRNDKSTWSIEYADAATNAQKAAAQQVMTDFDFNATTPTAVNTANDTKRLNDVLSSQGDVTRALAMVMFGEINKLRIKGGDAAYTLAQFRSAIRAQMRD